MRRFAGYIAIAIVLFATMLTTSCSRERTPRPKFQIISLDKVGGTVKDGWRITLTVANNTARNITITNATATLLYKGRKVGILTLNDMVVLPRRQCSKVEIPLQAKFSYSALPLLGKVRKGDLSGITVDYSLSLSALTRLRTFEQQGIPLEELAKKFNLGLKK